MKIIIFNYLLIYKIKLVLKNINVEYQEIKVHVNCLKLIN